jgi:SAM-dependent methyltransferase
MIFTGPHDYFNRDYVREWTESANTKRPFRAGFIYQFAKELSGLSHAKILDLGAGPGFLAERILSECEIASYHLFDFSPHMLELARERLARFGERTSFHQGSFLDDDWGQTLPAPFDAVVSIQAVHELSNASRVARLYRELGSLLNQSGILLIADEVASDGDDAGPFLTIDGHHSALTEAGFEEVCLVLTAGDLAMFSARRHQTTL